MDPPIPFTENPILFVTQVPTPDDFLNVTATFGNHLGRPRSAPRGGDLWIRYPDGTLKNLTQLAGYGQTGLQTGGGIAVREPAVHWNGQKAVFSMVVGSPNSGQQTDYFWQLYEVTGLGIGATPVITKVANQPVDANNVSPIYGSDNRIIFTTDRPRNGEAHLYPQLDEYEESPTNTGLWSLNPQSGDLFMMNHAPSGSFKPIIDSFGRVVFTRWDHMERDQQTDLELMGQGLYGTFNYSDESAGAAILSNNDEVFPEPRTQWIAFVENNPGYSGPLNGYEPQLNGNAQNHFFTWTINQDGTEEETLNHVGRQELWKNAPPAVNDDPFINSSAIGVQTSDNTSAIENMFQVRESPLLGGIYIGIDAREFFTHSAGQVIAIAAGQADADKLTIAYMTNRVTHTTDPTPPPEHTGLYRNPLPLSNGEIVVSHTASTVKDENAGTPTQPISLHDFRLKTLILDGAPLSGADWIAGDPLTSGITKSVSYWDPFKLVSYSGELWELDPVEVVAKPVPTRTTAPPLGAPEMQILAEENVDLADLVDYLESENLALIVSRDMTTRDDNDRQQPYNLKVAGTSHQTTGSAGQVYEIDDIQFFQGDQIRGLTGGGSQPIVGRRVLATEMHDPAVDNPPNPGGPPASVSVQADGSMAALVPARRAMSWQLTDPSGDPVVRERYWVTFQPGEVRVCASCHGVNETDQAGNPPPTNPPEGLRKLLQHLKNKGKL